METEAACTRTRGHSFMHTCMSSSVDWSRGRLKLAHIYSYTFQNKHTYTHAYLHAGCPGNPEWRHRARSLDTERPVATSQPADIPRNFENTSEWHARCLGWQCVLRPQLIAHFAARGNSAPMSQRKESCPAMLVSREHVLETLADECTMHRVAPPTKRMPVLTGHVCSGWKDVPDRGVFPAGRA